MNDMLGNHHVLLLRRFCCTGSEGSGFREALEWLGQSMLGEDMPIEPLLGSRGLDLQ